MVASTSATLITHAWPLLLLPLLLRTPSPELSSAFSTFSFIAIENEWGNTSASSRKSDASRKKDGGFITA